METIKRLILNWLESIFLIQKTSGAYYNLTEALEVFVVCEKGLKLDIVRNIIHNSAALTPRSTNQTIAYLEKIIDIWIRLIETVENELESEDILSLWEKQIKLFLRSIKINAEQLKFPSFVRQLCKKIYTLGHGKSSSLFTFLNNMLKELYDVKLIDTADYLLLEFFEKRDYKFVEYDLVFDEIMLRDFSARMLKNYAEKREMPLAFFFKQPESGIKNIDKAFNTFFDWMIKLYKSLDSFKKASGNQILILQFLFNGHQRFKEREDHGKILNKIKNGFQLGKKKEFLFENEIKIQEELLSLFMTLENEETSLEIYEFEVSFKIPDFFKCFDKLSSPVQILFLENLFALSERYIRSFNLKDKIIPIIWSYLKHLRFSKNENINKRFYKEYLDLIDSIISVELNNKSKHGKLDEACKGILKYPCTTREGDVFKLKERRKKNYLTENDKKLKYWLQIARASNNKEYNIELFTNFYLKKFGEKEAKTFYRFLMKNYIPGISNNKKDLEILTWRKYLE